MGKESDFEKKVIEMAGEENGKAYKFIASESGMPDRILVMPYGFSYWVEVKRADGKSKGLEPLQKLQKKRLAEMHHKVWVIDSDERLTELRNRIQIDQAKGAKLYFEQQMFLNSIKERTAQYKKFL